MKESTSIYELRTYVAVPGKLDALVNRFREHTVALFLERGMEVIGFWIPRRKNDEDPETIVYVLRFKSREEARDIWRAFYKDPEWISVLAASELDGPLQLSVESVFMDPADFSPLQ